MSQALVISDRYPAVPSVSRSSVRQCVKGYVSLAVWLRVYDVAIACSVRMRGGDSIPVWDSTTPL